MNVIIQIIGISLTVATFFGGIVLGYFHLALKANINDVKDEILHAVEEKYLMTVLADSREQEMRRRIRSLEHKVFGHVYQDDNNK